MKKTEILHNLLAEEIERVGGIQNCSIGELDFFRAGTKAALDYIDGTNKVELELYPDPEHDTHWEREKVKFLREGFRSGYSLHRLYTEIKDMQEKYKDAAT